MQLKWEKNQQKNLNVPNLLFSFNKFHVCNITSGLHLVWPVASGLAEWALAIALHWALGKVHHLLYQSHFCEKNLNDKWHSKWHHKQLYVC